MDKFWEEKPFKLENLLLKEKDNLKLKFYSLDQSSPKPNRLSLDLKSPEESSNNQSSLEEL